MYILIMIVLFGSSGTTMSHIYYENELSCTRAAQDFESHTGRDVRFKAFCVKGDN